MTRFFGVVAAAVLVVVGVYFGYLRATAPAPTGYDPSPIAIGEDPVQDETALPPAFTVDYDRGSAVLTPRARFRLTGKVRGLNHLTHSKFHGLIPYDLCVAWGRLAVEDMRGKVRYKHDSLRLVWVHVDRDAPVDWDYARLHFSNSHLICADPVLCKALGRLGKGDEVEIAGLLVDAAITETGADRPIDWKTSMTRDDGGLGACETIYVTSLRAGGKRWGATH